MRLVTLIFGVLLACTSLHVGAYSQATHMTFTEEAFKASELDDQSVPKYKVLQVSRKSAIAALIQGAFDEDDPGRRAACGHFYPSVPYFSILGCLPTASPDWILNGSGQIPALGFEEHSLRLANKYFYDALVSPNKGDRETNGTRLFTELGHVLHHIQDMAQPQHVRQDQHCDIAPCLIVNSKQGSLAYEIYSDLLKDQARSVIRNPVYGKDSASSFRYKTARDFWSLADYTSSNFLSYHTNFQGLFGICNSGIGYCSDLGWPFPSEKNTSLSGITVRGRYPINASEDQPISSVSSFVPFPFVNAPRYFTLTDENYEIQRKFLFERAVNYSAGFLNFYFRADIDATLSASRKLILKNKGKEALSGKFTLYYDDPADNARKHLLTWWGSIPSKGEQDSGLEVPADKGNVFVLVFSSTTTPGTVADEVIAATVIKLNGGPCEKHDYPSYDSGSLTCYYDSGRVKLHGSYFFVNSDMTDYSVTSYEDVGGSRGPMSVNMRYVEVKSTGFVQIYKEVYSSGRYVASGMWDSGGRWEAFSDHILYFDYPNENAKQAVTQTWCHESKQGARKWDRVYNPDGSLLSEYWTYGGACPITFESVNALTPFSLPSDAAALFGIP
jgi:hypothetical protein